MLEQDPMLTTYDNPINPFIDFIGWWKRDLLLGHDCCGTLAREAAVSDLSGQEVSEAETFEAMKRIVNESPMIYRIVYPKDFI